MKSKRRVKRDRGGLLAALAALVVLLVCVSCNVTRTVTTSSQYFQKGDSSCVIMTKTIESYDGSVKPK